ncbi:MAG TPA: hypothetical protein VLG44_08170 [Chlamydiales bacterium]|nr:hypothetical protein [Chlamydiales bacterium]
MKSKIIEDFLKSIKKQNLFLHNFTSLFMVPIVMGIKTSLHLGRCIKSAAGFSVSCVATVATLGLSKEVNRFAKNLLLETFEELGEGILSTANLAFIQSVFAAGTFANPKLPAMLVKNKK